MSECINGVAVIAPEPDKVCSECGLMKECRPYGRKGALVCYDCADKIPDIIEHNINIQLFGEPGELW